MTKTITDQSIIQQVKLAKSHLSDKNYDIAIEQYKKIIKLVNDEFVTDKIMLLKELGNCYYYKKDYDNAILAYEYAVNLGCNELNVYNMLGFLYFYINRDKSVTYYLKGMEIKPTIKNFTMLTQVLIKDKNFHQKDLKEIFEKYIDIFRPQILNGEIAFQYNHKYYDKNKKLRIGYLSSDFHCHAMMTFVLPIIEKHDYENFDIFLYSCDKKNPDNTTKRLKATGAHFIDCKDLTNKDLAVRIYDDKIDILIDLSGYTHEAIWSLLYKPAPIICQYLGFLGTYGMKEVDYILTDKFTIPDDMAKYYTEKPLYIDDVMNRFTFNSKSTQLPDITPLPYDKNGYITFGSFNCMSKINPYTVKLWSKALKANPTAKLLIYRTQMTEKDIKRLTEQFKENEIDINRIEFNSDKMEGSHFKSYLQCDIALDPSPFSGLTITIEQALMGIPVITMPSDTFSSKGAARVNFALQLDGLVAKDEDDFCNIAAGLNDNIEEIRWLRNNLRTITMRSPICTGYKHYTENIEHAYTKIWQDFCEKGYT